MKLLNNLKRNVLLRTTVACLLSFNLTSVVLAGGYHSYIDPDLTGLYEADVTCKVERPSTGSTVENFVFDVVVDHDTSTNVINADYFGLNWVGLVQPLQDGSNRAKGGLQVCPQDGVPPEAQFREIYVFDFKYKRNDKVTAKIKTAGFGGSQVVAGDIAVFTCKGKMKRLSKSFAPNPIPEGCVIVRE